MAVELESRFSGPGACLESPDPALDPAILQPGFSAQDFLTRTAVIPLEELESGNILDFGSDTSSDDEDVVTRSVAQDVISGQGGGIQGEGSGPRQKNVVLPETLLPESNGEWKREDDWGGLFAMPCPEKWTCEEVYQYFSHGKFAHHAQKFLDHEIRGDHLLALDEGNLAKMGVKKLSEQLDMVSVILHHVKIKFMR